MMELAKERCKCRVRAISRLPLPLGEGRGEGLRGALGFDINPLTKSPHPAYGHPLPQGEGERSESGLPCPSRKRDGFTLLEVAISTLLVGVLIVGAMKSLGAATRSRHQLTNQVKANLLAQELMSEIVQQSYAEPTQAILFGLELSEALGGRTQWDDVDDYHGLDNSPPKDPSGAALAAYSDWREQVAVEFLDPADIKNTTNTDQGIKRITVTISRAGKVLRQLIAVRTNTDEG